MSIQSAGFSEGRKGCLWQFCIPYHMVPPPIGLLLFSSLCRHWLLPRLGHPVPVKWHWLYNHSIISAFQPQIWTVLARP